MVTGLRRMSIVAGAGLVSFLPADLLPQVTMVTMFIMVSVMSRGVLTPALVRLLDAVLT